MLNIAHSTDSRRVDVEKGFAQFLLQCRRPGVSLTPAREVPLTLLRTLPEMPRSF